MTTRTWNGGTGDWFERANWNPQGAPETGDNLIISSGAAIISGSTTSGATITGEAITLGGSVSATSATLSATSATFAPTSSGAADMTLTVSGGDPSGTVLNAGFVTSGGVVFNGAIDVEATAGSLTINSLSSSFVNSGTIAINQESDLNLTDNGFNNSGTITINADTQLTIGNANSSSFTFSGKGPIVGDGGVLQITAGSRVTSPTIDLTAGNDLLAISSQATPPSSFLILNKPDSNILLQNFVTTSWQFVSTAPSLGEGQIALFDSQNESSYVFNVRNFNITLSQANFNVTTTTTGDTLINFRPFGGKQLFQPMPKPIIAAATQMVSLTSILQNSFGTATPFPSTNITLLPAPIPPDGVGYWTKQGVAGVLPTWFVNGVAITGPYQVQAGDNVQLLAGNAVQPISIQVQLSPAFSTTPVFGQYNIYTVDPSITKNNPIANAGGSPTAASVVASAANFATTRDLTVITSAIELPTQRRPARVQQWPPDGIRSFRNSLTRTAAFGALSTTAQNKTRCRIGEPWSNLVTWSTSPIGAASPAIPLQCLRA
jgi:hypothetical protein